MGVVSGASPHSEDIEGIRQQYLYEDCWVFAIALAQMNNWSLGWVSEVDEKGVGFPIHGYAVTPEGQMIDASGFVTARQVKKRHGIRRALFAPVAEKEMSEHGGVDDLELVEAKNFISKIRGDFIVSERSKTSLTP